VALADYLVPAGTVLVIPALMYPLVYVLTLDLGSYLLVACNKTIP